MSWEERCGPEYACSKLQDVAKRPEYWVWRSMLNRVDGKTKSESHKRRYVERGIGVADRWRKFEHFFADMGPRPDGPKGHWTLERIDNDKGYEPGNCRWADWADQARNRSNTQLIEISGIKTSANQWAKILNCRPNRDAILERAQHLKLGGFEFPPNLLDIVV